ncbi:MAG: 3-keto-5-aminohexanoate cleavage protein [Spirochaetales bacterium]|nr:MAG: 3-keto-5-aminohexanoate cleavage protein [Spirochaetales bacterium]
MSDKTIFTCAVTGSGSSHLKYDGVPKSPEEIASAAIKAAKAGASIVHLHVREPGTGTPCRSFALYEETVRLIRSSGVDVIINLTTGMGGDYIPVDGDPACLDKGSDMACVDDRMEHIVRLKPEICTLDCGSFNDGENISYISTLDMLRNSAKQILAAGVIPEIEAFELGHIWQAKVLLKENLLPKNTIFQLCMGIPYAAEATVENVIAMKNALPTGYSWGAFGIGRNEMAMLAQSWIMGGNCRVGLEDNIYLEKGVFATNEQLVERGVDIIRRLGGNVMSPSETRVRLGLA